MLKLGKKLNYLIIFWILFYILVFGFLLKNSFSYLDPDLGWHLKVGEAISQTWSMPHANIYNYTYTGRWVDHEWLINLVSFEIYNNLGYLALNIFFALVITASFVLLNLLVRKYFKKTPLGLLVCLQIFGLIASASSFGIRMQEFSFLFLILEFWIIKSFIDKRSGRSLVWLLPLFYLWSNIHGSFIFGLGILGFFIFVKLIERWLLLSKGREYLIEEELMDNSNFKNFALFSLASLLVTFLTPYGFELYSFLGSYANTFYLTAIQEWLSQFSLPFQYWQLGYLFLIILILGPYFYNVIYKKKTKINLWQLSLVILFLIISFKSRRNFPLAFIATFPFLLLNLTAIFRLESVRSFSLNKWLKYFLLSCMGIVIIGQTAGLGMVDNPFSSYCNKYPCQALEFLKKETQYKDLNLFNDYNWGGYLVWAYPEKKIFIDGRLPQTEFAGHTYLEEYYEFFKKGADFEKRLNQYNIGLVLLKTHDDKIVLKKWEKFLFFIRDSDLNYPNYLRYYLESSDKWKKIYSDPTASVYLKK